MFFTRALQYPACPIAPRIVCVLLAATLLSGAGGARAEKADKEKPINY